jgi:hypothetical protein
MGAQLNGGQQGGQPSGINPMMRALFGIEQKIHLQNPTYSAMDEMLARARQQSTQNMNVPSIADLFPQLASSQYLQGQDLQQTQQNINPYAQYNMLQGEQTAPAPVSSGAGRFMGTSK